MTTYETFSILIQLGILVIALLAYLHRKNKRK